MTVLLVTAFNPSSIQAEGQPDIFQRYAISIQSIPSPHPGGYGYRIEYQMPVPLHVCWRFKTDFGNDFLRHNRIIASHRLLHHTANQAVTETVYTSAPDKRFVWETTTDARRHQMFFRLLNPHAAGQRYHAGVIRLVDKGRHTLIIQEAHFDFFGAGFWVHYPWQGGMREILETSARWEQKTVYQLQAAYR
jgi:hypothetical protein